MLRAEGQGFLAFLVVEDQVRRFACPTSAVEAFERAGRRLDEATLKATQCVEKPGAGGQPVRLDAFVTALRQLYARSVGGDTNLTPQEELVLNELVEAVKDPKATLAAGEVPQELGAIRAIEARWSGVLSPAFDKASGREVAPEPAGSRSVGSSLSNRGTDATPRGVPRAVTPPVELGKADVRLPRTATTANVVVRITSGTPVDILLVDPRGAGGTGACSRIQTATVTRAKTGTGTVDATSAGGLSFRLATRSAVTELQLRLQVGRGTVLGQTSCQVVVLGQQEGGEPPRPEVDARDAPMGEMMGGRAHRLWHFAWHGVRNAWPRMNASQRRQVRERLGAQWGREDAETPQNPQPDIGEEFLHMHRTMITALTEHLKSKGMNMYEPWTEPPGADDRTYPTPKDASDPGATSVATLNKLRDWDRQAKDMTRLKGMSLGEYGEWLERTMHNTFHMRWAAESDFVGQPGSFFDRTSEADLKSWESPTNRYLGSTYTSHVHPFFWRLHGYVNARIEDWLKAHGYTSIAENCTESNCYQWKRRWTGPIPHAPAPSGPGLLPQQAHSGHGSEDGIDAETAAFDSLDDTLRRMITENSVMPMTGDDEAP